MRNFISVQDAGDIDRLVNIALDYKAHPFKDLSLAQHRRVGMLFLNPSMRTRLSTQVAAQNLGLEAIVFNVDKDGWQLEHVNEDRGGSNYTVFCSPSDLFQVCA